MEEIEDTKKTFRSYLTFSMKNFLQSKTQISDKSANDAERRMYVNFPAQRNITCSQVRKRKRKGPIRLMRSRSNEKDVKHSNEHG